MSHETEHCMALGGYVVDTVERTVGGPAGGPHGLDRLEVANDGLFYARAIPADANISYQETWLISLQGWAITRFAFHEHLRQRSIDWKMELDQVELDGSLWRVSDGYLDLDVYEGTHYDLEDADELANAIVAGAISLAEGMATLHALDTLCKALRRHGYSGQSLLREYAPGLPQ
jgi:predicted RNA-binding protein associated with RNAse of E/G family